MNTHKPDPSIPISTANLDRTPSASEGKLNHVHEMYIMMTPIEPTNTTTCVCDSATGTTCMLHFNLDGFILAEALNPNQEES